MCKAQNIYYPCSLNKCPITLLGQNMKGVSNKPSKDIPILLIHFITQLKLLPLRLISKMLKSGHTARFRRLFRIGVRGNFCLRR